MRKRESDRLMRGFTLIEILVTIAILLALVSITIVGLGKARQAGRAATTNSFMQAIVTGLEGFEQDHDFLPASSVPNTTTYSGSPMYESAFNDRWYGGEILAQALMGYAQDDTATPVKALDHQPPWTASGNGTGGGYGAKKLNRSNYVYATTGRSLGPYVELKSDESLVKTMEGSGNESDRYAFSSPANRNGEPILYFRRDRNPNMTDPANDPLWGVNAAPDRYTYNIEDNSGRSGTDNFSAAASDKAFEYLQTQWDARDGNAPGDPAWLNFQDFNGLETSMKSAEYILIAPGEDGAFGGTADSHDDILITGN